MRPFKRKGLSRDLGPPLPFLAFPARYSGPPYRHVRSREIVTLFYGRCRGTLAPSFLPSPPPLLQAFLLHPHPPAAKRRLARSYRFFYGLSREISTPPQTEACSSFPPPSRPSCKSREIAMRLNGCSREIYPHLSLATRSRPPAALILARTQRVSMGAPARFQFLCSFFLDKSRETSTHLSGIYARF